MRQEMNSSYFDFCFCCVIIVTPLIDPTAWKIKTNCWFSSKKITCVILLIFHVCVAVYFLKVLSVPEWKITLKVAFKAIKMKPLVMLS